jgi:GntR family transcriptional repressor for pyruvate dehydrogenase complex
MVKSLVLSDDPLEPVTDSLDFTIEQETPARTVAEELAAQLRWRIQGGELAAGDRLPAQRDLARELGVARPTLQHALRTLEDQGYVETRRGATGGTFVRPLEGPAEAWFETVRHDLSELEDILAFRTAVEVEAAALAALRRTAQHLETLRESQDLLAASGSSADFRRADSSFHNALGAASGSARLESAARRARGELFSPIDRALRPRLVQVTLRDHAAILRAVERRDPLGASTAVRAHIETTRTELRKAAERTTTP